MPEMIINEQLIPYTIVRSRRKTVSMSVKNGSVEVKAALWTPEIFIKNFIDSHAEWILKELKKDKSRLKTGVHFEFNAGDNIPFFGNEYPLRVTESVLAKIPRIYLPKNQFEIVIPPNLSDYEGKKKINKALKQWYIDNTLPKLKEKVDFFAQLMGITYKKIRIKDVTSHWGSCSVEGNLNFNYRIALLPKEAIDYIIVHELSHRREMNHSARFWKHVASVIPQYQKIRADLRKRSISVE